MTVTCDPPPFASGSQLLFPDLALERAGRCCYVEIVGFATAEYLTTRRARYRAAGADDVILCVDDRHAGEDILGPGVVRYERRVDPAAVLAHFFRR